MRSVPSIHVPARTVMLLVAAVVCVAWPSPAGAAPMTLRADVGVGRQIDVDAFERIVARRYHIEFRKVVAADVDRDGDVDVVAATDRGFIVWLNDGAGHLTSQPPAHRPSVDGSASGASWHGRDTHVDDPLQNDLPSTPLPGFYTHAPPALLRAAHCYGPAALRPEAAFGCRTPRAPPA
jgi:hypothetical protein